MKLKKSKEANLESKRSTFLVIGYVITLACTLLAFEWKEYDAFETMELRQTEDIFEEEIDNTFREEIPPPPPPPPPPDIIVIVEDDVELEEEMVIEDIEIEEETAIEVEIAEEEEEVDEEEIFQIVEDMPTFPGGDAALYKFIQKYTRFPQIAVDAGIQGKVYVSFVIDKDGKVIDVKVVRGIGGGCDKEAIRVIKKMPAWKPGKQRGKPVKVSYTVPVFFKLE